ncbi:MAG: hypothetical protein ACM31C_19765 [Acidobacteriota bacterium]
MKRDPKDKKKLTFSADKLKPLEPVAPDQLANVNGGCISRPCGLTYRG